MAKRSTVLEVAVQFRVRLSLWDAIKLRVAGGKAFREFMATELKKLTEAA